MKRTKPAGETRAPHKRGHLTPLLEKQERGFARGKEGNSGENLSKREERGQNSGGRGKKRQGGWRQMGGLFHVTGLKKNKVQKEESGEGGYWKIYRSGKRGGTRKRERRK